MGGENRPRGAWGGVTSDRLLRLPRATVLGLDVPVAIGPRARLLGLAGLSLERAGPGLLIPRCASVHTFGMRFALDLVFLDAAGRPCALRLGVGPRRLAWVRGARAVLELPAPEEPAICGQRR